MSAARWSAATAIAILTSPRRACRRIAAEPRWRAMLVLVGVLHAVLAAVQWRLVAPVLARDPVFDGDPFGPRNAAFATMLWVALAAGAPLVLAARVGALAWVLRRACPAPFAPLGTWITLAAAFEIVSWIEAMLGAVVVAAAAPPDLETLRTARLHAGLGLVWPRATGAWAAWLGACDAFVLWWAVLVGTSARIIGGASRGRATAVAIALAAVRVATRALWSGT
jgi:hypothetical protein